MTDEPSLRDLRVQVCEPCIAREGSECHTPGCLFWMTSVDDLPVTLADHARASTGGTDGRELGAIKTVEFDGGPLHDCDMVVARDHGALPIVVVAPDSDERLMAYVLNERDQRPVYRYGGPARDDEATRCPRPSHPILATPPASTSGLAAWLDEQIGEQTEHARRRAVAELYHGALVASIHASAFREVRERLAAEGETGDRGALVPSIEERHSTLDEHLRPLVRARLAEWAVSPPAPVGEAAGLVALRSKLDEWLAENGINQDRRTAIVQVLEWLDARRPLLKAPLTAPLPSRVGVCLGRGRTTSDCPGAFGYCGGCPVHPDRPATPPAPEGEAGVQGSGVIPESENPAFRDTGPDPGELAELVDDLHASWSLYASVRTTLTLRPEQVTAERLRTMCQRMLDAEGPILAAKHRLRSLASAPPAAPAGLDEWLGEEIVAAEREAAERRADGFSWDGDTYDDRADVLREVRSRLASGPAESGTTGGEQS